MNYVKLLFFCTFSDLTFLENPFMHSWNCEIIARGHWKFMFHSYFARCDLCAAAMTVVVACGGGCPSGTVFSPSPDNKSSSPPWLAAPYTYIPFFCSSEVRAAECWVIHIPTVCLKVAADVTVFSFYSSSLHHSSSPPSQAACAFAKLDLKTVEGRKKVAYEKRLQSEAPAPYWLLFYLSPSKSTK